MNTLFDKIWDAHVVQQVEDGPVQLYIDRLYCHEVTIFIVCRITTLLRMIRTNLSRMLCRGRR